MGQDVIATPSAVPPAATDTEPAVYGRQSPAERWEIDRGGSSLTFTLRQMLVQQVSGSFGSWGGTLFLDRRQPSLSRMTLWVDLDSVDTESMERDTHLCSAEFFDVARYPRATFESTEVKIGDRAIVVRGRLRLHGIVQHVELSITPMAMPENATIGQRETFDMSAALNRQAFGLRWNERKIELVEAVVGDQIHLNARVEMVRAIDQSLLASS
ncbi:MAG: hypothetical protein QOI66_616 [Myxococcales bacterium]|nr:hypothetical protein [Myxococcales bacterium]